MSSNPTNSEIEQIKQRYPTETRIVLHKFNDSYINIPPGTKGTVKYVDDLGQIEVAWDNGMTLALLPKVDCFFKDTSQEKQKHPIDVER